MFRPLALTLAAFTATALPLAAEMPMSGMDHAGHMAQGGDDWAAMMEKMHSDMDIAPTGDPDRDFLAAMIPHHEGAIAMADYVLAHGKDPEVRALAERIRDAQSGEIAWMRDWLAQHGE
ncbi:CopM family metallochaperone [Oceaniglobus roseus]|uniref:CopM family metallochaperone n=1 Tax=Oceaniglobus roseus TaxID=1737570 RepID=UPI000C7F431F|nr:DUF305 domain-containing protein [Kandeliimicrobium roseum]